MEKVLTDIQAQLATVSLLKYTDQDSGQLDYYGNNPPVAWPCGLVGLERVQWKSLGGLKQEGAAVIRIRVANQRLVPSSSRASATQKDAAMAIHRQVDAVTKALHGWTANQLAVPAGQITYGKLTRTATNRIPREDGLQVYEVFFSVAVYEDFTPPPITVMATPVITSP